MLCTAEGLLPLCDALECSSPAGKKQHVTAAAIACWQPPAVKGKDTRIITTRWHQLSIYTSPTTSSIKQPQQPCPLLLLQLNTSFFSCYIQFLMFCILLSVHSDNTAGVALESMRGGKQRQQEQEVKQVVKMSMMKKSSQSSLRKKTLIWCQKALMCPRSIS